MFRKTRTILLLLLILCFSGTLLGNDSALKYFPATIGSYWVYEDQDGNELTRRAVEGEEISGEMYQAFEYEPAFENWENYEYHIHPTLFMVDDSGIKFHIGDTVKKAYKERLTNDLQSLFENRPQNMPEEQMLPKFEVVIENQDDFYMLPFPITLNEEWDTIRIKPTVKVTMSFAIPENDPELAGASFSSIMYFTILETGNIIAKETVETPAGKFDNCLKIEYQTETVMPKMDGRGEDPKAGESVTTVWLAPDVGIVKFYQEAEKPMIGFIDNLEPTTQVKTFELKKYEIKSEAAEGE